MKRREPTGTKRSSVTKIVSQTGVKAVDAGELGGKSMTVTSEKLGPEKTEKLFDDDGPSSPGVEAAGDAAARDADEAAERRKEREARAPTSARELTMGEGFERIITHQFRVTDFLEDYGELRAALRFGGRRASSLGYGELVDALDSSEENAHRAAELAAAAKVAHDEFELNAKVILGTLRKEALDELNKRKAELKAETKLSGKAISEDDIAAEILAQFPDEYRDLETRRSKAKRSISLLEDLASKLTERARDLRAMVSRSRATD